MSDLDEAERLGVARAEVDGERAGIFQAVGRYDDAFAIRNAAVELRRDFETQGALAVLHAERGETAAAEAQFDLSRALYRAVSPFPLAMLDFQRGRMWMEQEDFPRAQFWFGAASCRLPAYAPAQGHLSEVEAALVSMRAPSSGWHHSRYPPMILITLPNLPASSPRATGLKRPERGSRGPQQPMTPWWRAIRRSTPTTQRNSG